MHSLKEHIDMLVQGEMLGPYYLSIGITTACNMNCRFCGRKLPHILFTSRDIDGIIRDLIKQHGGGQNISGEPFLPRECIIRGREMAGSDIDGAIEYVKKCLLRYFTHEMDLSTILRIVDEAAEMKVASVSLAGIGEPFSRWRELRKIMRRVKEHGMEGSITTNGTLLDSEKMRFMVDIGWDVITFSIDSHIPEKHDSLRGMPGSHRKIIDAIRWFKENADGKPAIGINTVLTSENIMDAPDIIEMAHELGAVSVDFIPLMVHTVEMASLDPEKVNGAKDYLREAESRARKLGIGTDAGFLARSGVPLSIYMYIDASGKRPWEFLKGEIMKEYGPMEYIAPDKKRIRGIHCLEPWISMVIDTNGGVKPCCMPYMSFLNINVERMTLREAWYSTEMNYMRNLFVKGSIPEECSRACHPVMLLRTRMLTEQYGFWNRLMRFLHQ